MVRKSLLAFVVALFLISGVSAVHAVPVPNIGGMGDLLLGSAYDVRALTATNGVGLNTTVTRPTTWENFIEISNTSNSWVAFHLRFRSASKSIEVWDHIILLSPYDVFWLSVQRDKDHGGMKLYSSDTQTLLNSGLITGTATAYSWSIYGQDTSLLRDCGYIDDEMLESEMGYVEAIGLWSIASTNHSISAIATAGYTAATTPNVFDLLYYMWGSGGVSVTTGRISGDRPLVYGYSRPITSTVLTNYQFVDCPNVLRGSIEMGDPDTGAYQTDNFIGVKSFRTSTTSTGINHRDGYGGAANSTVSNGGVIGYPIMLALGGSRAYTVGGLGSAPLGSNPREIAWYANADVATTAGPILKDGDCDTSLLYGGIKHASDPIVVVGDPSTNSDYGFNSPWSLFDLEHAFDVDELWGFYLNSKATDTPFIAINKSIAVLTFFTKHDHFLFAGWLTGAVGTGSSTGISSIMDSASSRLKSSLWAFWNGEGINYSIAETYAARINTERALVAAKWLAINGAPGYAKVRLLDMNQNVRAEVPGPSPSPWAPNFLPDEMNMVDFGDVTGILKYSLTAGQFGIGSWQFDADEYASYFTCDFLFPVIGMVIRDNYKGTGALHRTSSSPYQFLLPGEPN